MDQIEIDENKFNSFVRQMDSSLVSDDGKNNKYSKYPDRNSNSRKRSSLSNFNPNLDSYDLLLEKGLYPSIAKNISNYREKGGVFRSKSDLEKLYSVNENSFRILKPFITIDNQVLNKLTKQTDQIEEYADTAKTLSVPVKVIVDINTASVEELKEISGIGDFYAKNIIETRAKLGGFYSPDQLEEVFGMKEETIEKIKPFLKFNTSEIIRMNVNALDYKALAKHPYFTYKEAQAIVSYRQQHGAFGDIEELKKLHILKGKDLNKLRPYLDVN